MAAKSFLSPEDEKAAQIHLEHLKAVLPPRSFAFWREFSLWLDTRLTARLSRLPGWAESEPVLLGSWSRGELCPRSDIDVLFVGEEDAVRELLEQSYRDGLRLRYRMPEDPEDWQKGVESFDVLALLHARTAAPGARERLEAQKARIRERGEPFAKHLLKAMLEERQHRARRYDSISNYLEPNLKYGQGGLRDLQQALYIHDLFADRFSVDAHALKALSEAKSVFLGIRQALHLRSGSDVIVATEQRDLAHWLGFPEVKDFMREVQRDLARVSFYADGIVARAQAGRARRRRLAETPVKSLAQAFSALEDDPSILMQEKIRTRIRELFDPEPSRSAVGRLLQQHFHPDQKEEFFVAVFRSRLMESCLPELKRLEGLVQHDQYHRFTADAHVLQAVREFIRVVKRPRVLGRLGQSVRELDLEERKILLWTCVYHDIAKGRGGDHSTVGARLVEKDFSELGLPARLATEVAWMVENHLLLSTAAFRRNPQSPTVWKELHDRGVTEGRLTRLALFTGIDIRATNPEAWNEWKDSLLVQLVEILRSPQVERYTTLLAAADKKGVRIDKEFLRGLDPALVEDLAPRELLADYARLIAARGDLPVRLVKAGSRHFWIRFHRRKDQPGLFKSFTQALFAAGCNIQQASVHTFDRFGAYDWFKVATTKSREQLKRIFSLAHGREIEVPNVAFDRIRLVSREDGECTISFRGRDQKGALIAAAEALHAQGLVIRWARVHTWGRQIDDVFGVLAPADIDSKIAALRRTFSVPDTPDGE